MTMWENTVCRVCSSPADYDIFEKIPNYLHSASNEFIQWQKTINELLEEATGLKVTKGDGLPETICAICISYLKHAINFREQAIKNAINLKISQVLNRKKPSTECEDKINDGSNQKRKSSKKNLKRDISNDKLSLLITENDLNFAEQRQVDTNLLLNNALQDQDKVQKQLLKLQDPNRSTQPQQSLEQQMYYLNLLFDKDPQAHKTSVQKRPNATNINEEFVEIGESDENDLNYDDNSSADKGKKNIFSYEEKNFEEDDIMDTAELRGAVSITIPEIAKERKCRACFRRFMFDDSFESHTETCIELNLLVLIEDMNRFLDIRKNKAISPHEFIRRTIFCLRKTCEWLRKNCNDMLVPELLTAITDNGNKNGNKNDNSRATEHKRKISTESLSTSTTSQELELQRRSKAIKEMLVQSLQQKRTRKAKEVANLLLGKNITSKIKDLHDRDKNLNLVNLFQTPKQNAVNNLTKLKLSGRVTPINANNNVLYEIERSESRNSSNLKKAEITKIAATNYNLPAKALQDGKANLAESERAIFLGKLLQAASKKNETKTPEIVAATPPASTSTSMITQTTPITKRNIDFNETITTPFISVRKDLLIKETSTPMTTKDVPPTRDPCILMMHGASTLPQTVQFPSPKVDVLMAMSPQQVPTIPPIQSSPLPLPLPLTTTTTAMMPPPPPMMSTTFSVRCNPCNIVLDNLTALETHNAIHHNNATKQKAIVQSNECLTESTSSDFIDAEHRRIIALFEDDEA